MSRRRTRSILAVGALAVGLVVAACTPSPPVTGPSEACAPDGTIVSRVVVTTLSAPPGATLTAQLDWHLYPGGGPLEDAGTYETTLPLVTGATVDLPASPQPDPGRCTRLVASAGASYQVTVVADPVRTLLRAAGLFPPNPNAVYGSPPSA
jgi:hypothetical protein